MQKQRTSTFCQKSSATFPAHWIVGIGAFAGTSTAIFNIFIIQFVTSCLGRLSTISFKQKFNPKHLSTCDAEHLERKKMPSNGAEELGGAQLFMSWSCLRLYSLGTCTKAELWAHSLDEVKLCSFWRTKPACPPAHPLPRKTEFGPIQGVREFQPFALNIPKDSIWNVCAGKKPARITVPECSCKHCSYKDACVRLSCAPSQL